MNQKDNTSKQERGAGDDYPVTGYMEAVCAKCGGTGIIKGGPTDSRKDEPCSCKNNATAESKQEQEIPVTGEGESELGWLIRRIRNNIELVSNPHMIVQAKENLREIADRLEEFTQTSESAKEESKGVDKGVHKLSFAINMGNPPDYITKQGEGEPLKIVRGQGAPWKTITISNRESKPESIPYFKRYESGVARHMTHFTTNLNAAEIKERYGVRFYDRLKESCNWIVLEGESFRE